MAFGLKPKDQLWITYKSGNLFDLVCMYLIHTKRIKNVKYITSISASESSIGIAVYLSTQVPMTVVNKHNLKIYKLKLIMDKL